MAEIKTLEETLQTLKEREVRKARVVKKSGLYLTIKNNELALSKKQLKALIFDNEEQVHTFIGNAIIDSRNDKVIGKSFGIVEITLSRPKR